MKLLIDHRPTTTIIVGPYLYFLTVDLICSNLDIRYSGSSLMIQLIRSYFIQFIDVYNEL